MFSAKIFILAVAILCINARCIKRQKKIKIVVPTQLPPGCLSVVDLPGVQALDSYGLAPVGCPGCGCPRACGCQEPCSCPAVCGCSGVYNYGCPTICSYPQACSCPSICTCPKAISYPTACAPCSCNSKGCGCSNLGPCGCPKICTCSAPCTCPNNPCSCPNKAYGCPNNSCGCPINACVCPKNACSCPNPCQGLCGCQSIFLEELPCGCNYECNCIESYGLLNDLSCLDRIPAIRLPQTFGNLDAGIPVPAINLPTLYQCPCQCQNAYQIDSCNTYDLLNPIDVPIIKIPEYVCACQPLDVCSCQAEVCGCQRQRCGCQEVPCSCQAVSRGCQFDLPCGCQVQALNIPQAESCQCGCPQSVPCGYQVDAPCSCGCQSSVCGCQSSICGCQSPCGCQVAPSVDQCVKYLRQVTVQPPFL